MNLEATEGGEPTSLSMSLTIREPSHEAADVARRRGAVSTYRNNLASNEPMRS